jgi:hypothetical protein
VSRVGAAAGRETDRRDPACTRRRLGHDAAGPGFQQQARADRRSLERFLQPGLAAEIGAQDGCGVGGRTNLSPGSGREEPVLRRDDLRGRRRLAQQPWGLDR